MEIKWVDDEVINNIRKGANSDMIPKFEKFLEELKKNPNRWAEYPDKVNSQPWAQKMRARYAGVETKATGGNSLKIGDPNKKLWTVYFRYVEEN
jgi:hypothetical protein